MEGKERTGKPRARAAAAALHGARAALRSPSAWLGVTFSAAGRGVGAAIAAESERRTWFNLLPVAFGAGIGAYFLADREPLWWGPGLALLLLGAGAFLARARTFAFAILLALAAAAGGLQAGLWRTERVAAPMLERIMIAPLSGFVESVEERTGDMRLVLAVTAFGSLAEAERPARVRVTSRKGAIAAGAHVTLNARLMPPPDPARPGGYDFGRDAFFRGFGAVGSGLGPISLSAPPREPGWRLEANAAIDAARNAMTERIARLIGEQAGAVAAALVTGKRGLISEESNEALRAAGLYHIVSISGLHMVLAAGSAFWIVRALLALFPAVALAWPVKKIAAGAAMLIATGYCVFSGAEVATVRSLIMTLIMLGAILADRPALSMRNLAIAALIVLAREPDALLGPSFQMSFGAVGALIAYAEWQRRRQREDGPRRGLIGRIARTLRLAVVGLIVTSIIASAATGPFGAFHFQTWNPYGLIGNVLALPFVSLVVMPAAVVGALLYPLGLDALAWWLMGLATAPVLAVSSYVAGFGGAVNVVPAFGVFALVLLGCGLAVLVILTTWLRLLAALPLAAGMALAASPPRADIFVDRAASGLAARAAGGALAVAGRPSAFVLEQWLRADGDARKPGDASLSQGAACDRRGCVITLAGGETVAWSRDPLAVSEDCERATVVVTPLRWDGVCAALMIDRATLDRFGAISVRVTPRGLVAATSRDPDSLRPWSRPEPRPRAPTAPPSSEATETTEADLSSALRD
jgi:competence protein ComEC